MRQAQGVQGREALEKVCGQLADADGANVQGGDVIEASRQRRQGVDVQCLQCQAVRVVTAPGGIEQVTHHGARVALALVALVRPVT
ncbi:hypothetical protein D3C80_1568040 [compost metagenome]